MAVAAQEQVDILERRLAYLESRLNNINADIKTVTKSELTENSAVVEQSEMQFGMYTALCVDTLDIWKQNKIRFYSPLFHDQTMTVAKLPWANAVSNAGGFDDCGMTWVPPAGSTVCIMFENGNRASPYYIGTTWHRNRGPDGNHNWGFNIDEYYKVSEGKRGGYMVGPDDGSQCLPPWNTENYNGFDLSSIVDFAADTNAQQLITYPNIYGWTTPEKHRIKLVDGDPRCDRKWKRIEIMSSRGNWFMMKDDHLHYAGQWANSKCGGRNLQEGEVSCVEGSSTLSEIDQLSNGFIPSGDIDSQKTDFESLATKASKESDVSCEGKESSKKIIGGHPSTGSDVTKYYQSQIGTNPFFKHSQECRPYRGAATPQNNVCDLPQSGIQIMSISGHTFVMDDSVEEPSGAPTWDLEFDFGCNNHYVGRTYWKSATGHSIEMSDIEGPIGEDGAQLRGEDNFIRILSANGNKIELNDHTKSQKDCPGCPPNIAGEHRGIHLQSTCNHTIDMIDEENAQCSECRMEGGVPTPKAKKALVRVRTGYGLEMSFNDDFDQEQTQEQNIQIFCPQKDNKVRGPHLHRYQETATGPGLVFLRVGGNYVVSTYDDHVTMVGSEKAPADLIEEVSRRNLVYTKDMYMNITDKSHYFYAKEKIMLLAGQDCKNEPNDCGKGCGGGEPCFGAVLVYDLCTGIIRISDRLFASTSANAPQASIFQMHPLIKAPNC